MAFFDSSRSYRDPKPDLRLKAQVSATTSTAPSTPSRPTSTFVPSPLSRLNPRMRAAVRSSASGASNTTTDTPSDCTATYTKIKHADPATKKRYRKSLPNPVTSSRPALPIIHRRKLEYRLSLDQDCLNPVFEEHRLQERDTRVLVVGRLRRVSDGLWKAVRHPPKALVLPQMVNARLSLLGRARRFVLGQIRRRVASRAAQISVSHYADFVSSRLGVLLVSRYPFLFPVILRLKPLKLARGSDAPFPLASFETEPVRGIFRRLEDLFYRRVRNIAGF
ncbi:hypothetical protein C8J57DRAFT_1664555 [Mycena rebaudengoi]|nr:hypothetical protein C8J57DRAFT_1664555 [Mycena rebaudengoi]